MQRGTEFVAASGSFGQAPRPSQARGEEERGGRQKLPEVLLGLGANSLASPPRTRLEKRFLLTNGESLQQGGPLLSQPVFHTEAYVLERRGEGPGSRMLHASLTRGDSSDSEEAGC